MPGAVMYTTQLYHALRQEKLLDLEWKGLETLQKMQGNSAYFIGEPPTSYEAYFKNYCLCMGVSTTNWAPNKRSTQVKASKNIMREMKFKAVTSTLVANRIATYGDKRALSAEVVVD